MTKLSICIPTFNRLKCLNNCLNSILIAKKNYNLNFEVCISDNCSDGDVETIVNKYKRFLDIKFNRNQSNLGLGVNILKSVSMAKGEFVWILGNDDLLIPEAFTHLNYLFKKNSDVDFFYINSFHLQSSFVFSHQQPFDTNSLPNKMKKFSNFPKSFKSDFLDLVNHRISFDFILGMFLAVFKKKNWDDNLNKINKRFLENKETYSTFDNTAPHIKIWASAFSNSISYFESKSLSVNTHGEREWDDLYPFVESIRIPEVLDYYRASGLNIYKYFYYKNFALRKLFVNLFKIYLFKNIKGSKYINFKKHILQNLIFPGIYLGLIYFLLRKIFKKLFRIKTKLT